MASVFAALRCKPALLGWRKDKRGVDLISDALPFGRSRS